MLLLLVFASIVQTMALNSASKTFLVNIPKNCKEIQDQGLLTSGVYSIKPDFSPEPFLVYCDMETSDGGWIYILNRLNGYENFSRSWNDYKYGFGDVAAEFWLGLDHLHQLTVNEINELLVELIDWDLNEYHVHYKVFGIGGEETDYTLQAIGGHSGDFTDALSYNRGRKFSTVDRDNDNYEYSCSEINGMGGWWYNKCGLCHLTGKYLPEQEAIDQSRVGINWYLLDEEWYSFKEAKMMIRPRT